MPPSPIKILSPLGEVNLTPTEYLPVSEIKTPDPEYWVSIDVAEEIVAIEGNRCVQVCFSLEHRAIYVIYHNPEDVSLAAVCKVDRVEFTAPGLAAEYFRFQRQR